MSGRILDSQRRWAQRMGLEVDASGAVANPRDHLMCPLSEESWRALGSSGLGLMGEEGKRGPLHALDSTHALLCHLVEPLRDSDHDGLAAALGGRAGGVVRLCAPLEEAGPDAPASEVDLLIGSAHPVAVLARYREPYEAPDRRRPSHPDAPAEAWAGLPGCRSLARDLRANPARFERLEVGRLLEAVRLLTRRHGPRGFRLVHLWFDGGDAESRRYAREVDRLRMRVGGDVELEVIAWRVLFERLRASGAYDDGYAEAIARRYFDTPQLAG